jgi:hypothetical protein
MSQTSEILSSTRENPMLPSNSDVSVGASNGIPFVEEERQDDVGRLQLDISSRKKRMSQEESLPASRLPDGYNLTRD